MTSRENFMKLYHHEPAEFVPADGPYDIVPVPGEHGVTEKVGDEALDWFGQSWSCTEAVGILADTPTPGKYVLNDISEWKEKDVIPFHMIDEFDWEGFCGMFTKDWDRENRISVCLAPAGFFERLHHLMPFEEALCSFYDDPDAVEEFMDALLEYKKQVYKKMKEVANPDVIIFFDDYGTSNNMFISKDLWDEFIAPRLKEIIRYCREDLGFLFEMHSCGYITPLVGDIVEMGIDALQPLQAMNDLRMVKENYGDRILIHGGITASDLEDPTLPHEGLVEKVQECVDILAPGGNFNVLLSEVEKRKQEVSDAFRDSLKAMGIAYGVC